MKVSIMGENTSRRMSIYFQRGELEKFGFTKNDKFEFSCIGTVVTVAKSRRHCGVALCRMNNVEWEAYFTVKSLRSIPGVSKFANFRSREFSVQSSYGLWVKFDLKEILDLLADEKPQKIDISSELKRDWEAMKSKAREHGFILTAAEGKLKLTPTSHEIEI